MKPLDRAMLLLLLAALLLGRRPPAYGEDGGPAPVSSAERDRAVDRALKHLHERIWRLPDAAGTPKKQFTVATTGVVWLLARQAGRLRTEYRDETIPRIRAYLLDYLEEVERRSRDERELPPYHGFATSAAILQYTWPLAMAALFFAESRAQGLDQEASADAVARIVKVLEEAQDPSGGWCHGRARQEKGNGYPPTLLSASGLVAGALGVVRRGNGAGGTAFLDKVPDYFRAAQLRNGSMPYDPSQRTADFDPLGAGRVAGALWALWALGVPPSDPVVRKATTYLDEHLEQVAEGHGSATLTLLLGAFAARIRDEGAWARYRETFFRRMVDLQAEDGSLPCIARGRDPGTTNDSEPPGGLEIPFHRPGRKAYVTALHALILLLDTGPPRAFTAAGPTPPSRRSPATPR